MKSHYKCVRVSHKGPFTLLRPSLFDVTESVNILSNGNVMLTRALKPIEIDRMAARWSDFQVLPFPRSLEIRGGPSPGFIINIGWTAIYRSPGEILDEKHRVGLKLGSHDVSAAPIIWRSDELVSVWSATGIHGNGCCTLRLYMKMASFSSAAASDVKVYWLFAEDGGATTGSHR